MLLGRTTPLPEKYRCFVFFHVRVGALLFALWQLVSQLCALSLVIALIIKPNLFPDSHHRLQVESLISFVTLGQNDAFLLDHPRKHVESDVSVHQKPIPSNATVKKISASDEGSRPIIGTSPPFSSTELPSSSANEVAEQRNGLLSLLEKAEGEKLKSNIFKKLFGFGENEAEGEEGPGESEPDSYYYRRRRSTDLENANKTTHSMSSFTTSFTTNSPAVAITVRRHSRLSDRFVSLAVVVFSMCFTSLLLVGCLLGRPSYLLPCFCLQVFDFVISSITVVGYFSYLPDMHHWIRSSEALPYRRELLHLNEVALSLLLLTLGVAILWMKFYLLSVLWLCYNFLVRRLNGHEVESGFCVYLPVPRRVFSYCHSRTEDNTTRPRLEMVRVPLRCCERLSGEVSLIDGEDSSRRSGPEAGRPLGRRLRSAGTAGNLDGSRASLLPRDSEEREDEMIAEGLRLEEEEAQLPKYDDLLMKPANANMPPPYFPR